MTICISVLSCKGNIERRKLACVEISGIHIRYCCKIITKKLLIFCLPLSGSKYIIIPQQIHVIYSLRKQLKNI